MAQWWDDVLWWANTTYVPLWTVCAVFIAYFCVKFWRETRLP